MTNKVLYHYEVAYNFVRYSGDVLGISPGDVKRWLEKEIGKNFVGEIYEVNQVKGIK